MRYWPVILGCLALAGGPALAQQSGGVSHHGNTRIDANAGEVNTLAIGEGNTAITRIGVIDEHDRHHGNVTVDVKNVDNIVTGHDRKGCINIGSSGKCE